jgi:hypothetical protein
MSDRDGTTGRFLPGNSGNGGRPRGARSKLSEGFLDALQADFERHGAGVIETVRQKDPTAYLKVVANLMPARLEAQLEAQVDVNMGGFGDTNSISDVLEMVAREAGHEAAVTLATMFGLEYRPDDLAQTILPPPLRAENICPHPEGSAESKAWYKRRGVG